MAVSLEVPKPSLAGQQLELSQLESYFVADDRPEYPMTFFVMVHLTGRLDREAFVRAMRTAIGRHPLLRARLAKTAAGKEVWEVHDDTEPVITWVEGNWPTGTAEPRGLDLHRENGLHAWVEAADDEVRIAWQVHHACVDGLGSLVFMEDVLVAYANEVGCGEGLKVRPLDPPSLRERLQHDKPEGKLPPLWKILRHFARQTFNHFVRVPVVLQPSTPHAAPLQPVGTYPQLERYTLDDSLNSALRECAISLEATLNEVLLAVLYQTIAEWQQKHPGPGHWLRVLMPTDLRNSKHAQSPACNVLGYTFLDRKPSECQSAAALVPGIVEQSGLIKKYRLGRSFLDGVAAARGLGFLSRMVRMRRSEATIVFTNPGDLTRGFHARFPRQNGNLQIGGLVLDDIYGNVPLRPGTRVCVMVTRQRRQYRLTWITDPRYFSASDRTELIQRYEDNLHALIRTSKPSNNP